MSHQPIRAGGDSPGKTVGSASGMFAKCESGGVHEVFGTFRGHSSSKIVHVLLRPDASINHAWVNR